LFHNLISNRHRMANKSINIVGFQRRLKVPVARSPHPDESWAAVVAAPAAVGTK
jgi:hypothetical protein